MSIADPSAALEEIGRFIDLIVKDRELEEAERGGGRPYQRKGGGDDERGRVNTEILRLQPLIEAIALEVDPYEASDRFKRYTTVARGWGWGAALNAAERLIGILEQQEKLDAILGPKGPLLAAGDLHRWVWNAAVDLWDSGHFKEAVQSAASAVEEQTRLKIDRSDVAGAAIFGEAFSLDPPKAGRPRLRFPHIPEKAGSGERSQEWISAHEGAMSFGRGCFQGIRNLQAHGTADLPKQQALECLAALSVLARWVDDARLDNRGHS
ncbi:TIGR02391 family protein [Candidatus Poriferisocius sp.]|uniref:TIGR02391 family protein n=1 Tax=Candidatus Poriferisocius sp. TaxID=3101276 RepID=UPI003B010BA2